MAYYPKSQVKTNLYTNGGEFTTDPNQNTNYQGYYFKVSNGQLFTGKTPSTPPNYRLYPISKFPTNDFGDAVTPPTLITYNTDVPASTFNKSNEHVREVPQFSLTLPTEQDKQNGYFTRYFCKKNNELKYFEINQTTCNKLTTQDPSIAFDLYSGVSFQWVIKGDLPQVLSINQSKVNQVASQNNWLGFSQYFKNYSQYYLGF